MELARQTRPVRAGSEDTQALAHANRGWIQRLESAAGWRGLRHVELDGVALHRIVAEPGAGDADHDGPRLDDEPGASLLWARYYEIPSNRPFVADRHGQKLYDWNGGAPAAVA